MGSDPGFLVRQVFWLVSIHAPAWGATYRHLRLSCPSFVSIHAPAWGATTAGCPLTGEIRCFNPRSRMGSDSISLNSFVHNKVFQSTLPHGERQGLWLYHIIEPGFNPRSRMGSDAHQLNLIFKQLMFQSTLPHGERHTL